MTDKIKSWGEIWLENYEGRSELAKSLQGQTKTTYKDDPYLPWAVMVRCLYQLDPDAEILKCQNIEGGYLFTDKCLIESTSKDVNSPMNVQTILSHMVKVRVKFLGKWFDEPYPIQEKDWTASKVFDQNKVNKALQRAVARCISTATGLGFRLYENLDLQFDDSKPIIENPKEEVKKANKEVVDKPDLSVLKSDALPASFENIFNNPNDEPVEEAEPPLEALVNFILRYKDVPKVLNVLDMYNNVLKRTYSVSIDVSTDTREDLLDKLKGVKNPETMLNGLRKVI